jgi:hypothetical protein
MLASSLSWTAAGLFARPQNCIWSQVNHFLGWVVYEGHRDASLPKARGRAPKASRR